MKTVSENYICYFDILGYKEMMHSLGENNFLQIIDATIQEVIYLTKRHVRFPFGDLKLGYRIFSDNVILFYHMPPFKTGVEYAKAICKDFGDVELETLLYTSPLNYNYELLYLSLLIEHSISIQRKLIGKYGIFIRGAIIKGNLYSDENYIYGQGLIDAYNLETTIAKYPRIVVSDLTCDYLMSFSKTERELHRIPNFSIMKWEKDNISFLNYLFMDDRNFWESHRNIISSKLCEYEKNDRIYEKYNWCKMYHNYIFYKIDQSFLII